MRPYLAKAHLVPCMIVDSRQQMRADGMALLRECGRQERHRRHGVQVPFDPNAWMPKASAAVAGGAITAALWAMLPQARRTHEVAAVNGVALGAAATVGSLVLMRLACATTGLCTVPLL